MALESFYNTGASLCFTLLGIWWAVVQFRHAEWTANIESRRIATAVSLHFLLPGIMCLISLLAGEVKIIWRIAFGMAGLIGFIATLFIILNLKSNRGSVRILRWMGFLVLPMYLLITIIASNPDMVKDFGLALTALEVEGIILSLLVFLGVNLAWMFLTEPASALGLAEAEKK